MAELVAKTNIKKEVGWLYYVDKQGNVSRSEMRRGDRSKPTRRETIAQINIKRDPLYLYFIDKQGNVSRAKMLRGKTQKKPIAFK